MNETKNEKVLEEVLMERLENPDAYGRGNVETSLSKVIDDGRNINVDNTINAYKAIDFEVVNDVDFEQPKGFIGKIKYKIKRKIVEIIKIVLREYGKTHNHNKALESILFVDYYNEILETKKSINNVFQESTASDSILENLIVDNQKSISSLSDNMAKNNEAISSLADNTKKNNEMINQNIADINEIKSVFDNYAPENTKLSFSQSGEDVIIEYILRTTGSDSNITYLDLGANHAKEINNTYQLYRRGGRGVLVEANPALIEELQTVRPEDIVINKMVTTNKDLESDFYILSGDGLSTNDYEQVKEVIEKNPDVKIEKQIRVKTISMEEIIQKYFSEKTPEVVNIDIEGAIYDILDQIDFETFRPLIYIIETIPYEPNIVIEKKDKDMIKYMQDRDYVEYAFTGINSIFVDKIRLLKAIKDKD